MAARRAGDIVEFAQRHLLAPRHVEQGLGEGLTAMGLRKVRHRRVERIAGEVMARRCETRTAPWSSIIQLCKQDELLLGLLVGFADDRHHARKDSELVRLAAVFGHPLLERIVVGLRQLGVAVDDGEDDVARPAPTAPDRAASRRPG